MSQVLAEHQRTARKPHRCELCTRRIDPGETYRDTRCVDMGSAFAWKCCAHCWAAVYVLDMWDFIDPDEGITSYDFDAWAPRNEHDAHVLAGWQARWRDEDGSLMPVPEREPAPSPVSDVYLPGDEPTHPRTPKEADR